MGEGAEMFGVGSLEQSGTWRRGVLVFAITRGCWVGSMDHGTGDLGRLVGKVNQHVTKH